MFGLVEVANAVILVDSDDLNGVEVIDDRTLRVRLTNPRADFPALLADPVAKAGVAFAMTNGGSARDFWTGGR